MWMCTLFFLCFSHLRSMLCECDRCCCFLSLSFFFSISHTLFATVVVPFVPPVAIAIAPAQNKKNVCYIYLSYIWILWNSIIHTLYLLYSYIMIHFIEETTSNEKKISNAERWWDRAITTTTKTVMVTFRLFCLTFSLHIAIMLCHERWRTYTSCHTHLYECNVRTLTGIAYTYYNVCNICYYIYAGYLGFLSRISAYKTQTHTHTHTYICTHMHTVGAAATFDGYISYCIIMFASFNPPRYRYFKYTFVHIIIQFI